jgi:hypothetical protein
MQKPIHRAVTTAAEIRAAVPAARKFSPADRRVTKVRYKRRRDRVSLHFADGVVIAVPRTFLQGLEDARHSQLADIKLLDGGSGVRWPQLDVDHYVLGLLNQVFGTRQWMSHLGQMGGASTSPAKAAAARANGRKGGRPRQRPRPASATNKKRAKTA